MTDDQHVQKHRARTCHAQRTYQRLLDQCRQPVQRRDHLACQPENPQDYLTYSLDIDERPRTEREDGDLLIILRIPYAQGRAADIPYTTVPMGIILTERFVVTVCRWENDILKELTSGRLRGLSIGKRNRFILRLLLNTADKYLIYLREINKVVDTLEDQLQKSTRNKEVWSWSNTKKA